MRRSEGANSAAEIRAEIEAARQRIADNLYELQHQVEDTVERALDWRGWVEQHPLPAVGIAFAVGFYLGLR